MLLGVCVRVTGVLTYSLGVCGRVTGVLIYPLGVFYVSCQNIPGLSLGIFLRMWESNWGTGLPAGCILGVNLSEHIRNVAGNAAGCVGGG